MESINRYALATFIIAALLFTVIPTVSAETDSSNVTAYFFWGDGCPHCAKEKPFLKDLEDKYPELDVKMFETWSHPQNRKLFQEMAEVHGIEARGVPTTFIGEKHWVGFSESRGQEMERHIQECIDSGCRDIIKEQKVLEKTPDKADEEEEDTTQKEGSQGPGSENTSNMNNESDAMTPSLPGSGDTPSEKPQKVSLPIIGETDLSVMPIYVTTGIIAFIDGFNPCSLWLITFLLGIVIYSNSRTKILTVGGTFLLVTGFAYALFMAGLLNAFMYIGYLQWIQLTVAVIAFIFAVVNIKDYFWYKKGISFTIPDRYKPKIFRGMRDVMKTDKSFTATIIGTAILALGVVLVELPCTAGFPLVWSNMMAQNQIQGLAFLMLLLLYMAIYLSIEIAIIVAALITMRTTRFEEKHGRVLKLVGGMIMLALALVMLINPDLMNNVSTTVLVFGSALAASLVVIFVHRIMSELFG